MYTQEFVNKYTANKQYVYVYTVEQYKEHIDRFMSLDSELAIDIETYALPEWRGKGGSALDPHTGRMSLIAIKARQTIPVVFDIRLLEEAEYDRRLMYELLKAKKLLAFRAQFELKFLKRHYGVIFKDVVCLNYLAKMIGNATGSKFAKSTGRRLDDMVRELFGVAMSGKGKEQVTDWYARPQEDDLGAVKYWFNKKLPYVADDVNYLHAMYDIMLPVVCNPLYKTDLVKDGTLYEDECGLGMEYIMHLDMESVRAAAEMEYNGLPVSRKILETLQLSLKDEISQEGYLYEAATNLCHIFGLETVPSLWGEGDIPTETSWTVLNSPTKFKHKVNKLVGTSLDTLQASQLHRISDLLGQLKEDGSMELISEAEEEAYKELQTIEKSAVAETSKAIQALLLYKKLYKQYSINLSKHINPLTGCIHSGLDGLGASTGRFCIAEGQKVTTVGGYKNIEDIKEGDLVYCYDDEGNVRVRPVINTWYKGYQETVKVNWNSWGYKNERSGSLVVTPTHRIKTVSDGWQMAKDLEVGQRLYHLSRSDSMLAGKNRPILKGSHSFYEMEQVTIKREYFGAESSMHIHHKDHISDNNDVDNLEIMTAADHCAYHASHPNRKHGWVAKCEWPRRKKEDAYNWIELSRFSLLRMLAKAKGKPSMVDMDFNTYKRKCLDKGLDIKAVGKRYGQKGVYLSKTNICKALEGSRNTHEASRKLGIGYARLKVLCQELEIPFTNHSVVSVVPNGYSHVYDIEVEEFHNFIAEEICSANSSAGPNQQNIPTRTYVVIDIMAEDLFVSEANFDAHVPDWSPFEYSDTPIEDFLEDLKHGKA